MNNFLFKTYPNILNLYIGQRQTRQQKIRYYGFLAHANKKICIVLLRQLINPDAEFAEKLTETVKEMMMRLTGIDISLCPNCGRGKMVYMEALPEPLSDTS